MKRLCSLILAVVFAFSLSLAQDAMKPQDTQTPPAKNTMKADKKKMAKDKKKTTKDKKKVAKDKKKVSKDKKKMAKDKKKMKGSTAPSDSTHK